MESSFLIKKEWPVFSKLQKDYFINIKFKKITCYRKNTFLYTQVMGKDIKGRQGAPDMCMQNEFHISKYS